MDTIIPASALVRLGRRTRDAAIGRETPTELYVSANAKTGASINVAIAGSCRPTIGPGGCGGPEGYCYGLGGRIAMTPALRRQADNLALLRALESAPQSEATHVAAALAIALDRETGGRGWFRWHGVGDLIPGTVRVIAELAGLRPTLVQWVVTRKPELASMLPDVACIRILASTDDATDAARMAGLLALRKRFKRARVRVAYTRQGEALPGKHVDIVFNLHRGRYRLDAVKNDGRVCGATLPGASHDDACDRCRACFAS